MSSRPHTPRFIGFLGAVAAAGALTFAPAEAAAQEESNAVSATGKGIAGGILLGAEVGMLTTAIIGVDEWWAYLLAGVVGGGGGGVGGYYVEDAIGEDGPAEPALYMLAGGMALVVPTVVAVLNVTAYDPSEEEDETEGESGEGEPGGTPALDANVEVETGARQGLPPALIGLDTSRRGTLLRMGVPAVQIAPAYSLREVATYGVDQETEVSVPLIRGTF